MSCHLLVSRSGRVTRLVGDQQRAWHAGLSWWRGTRDVNSVTLGIEIANRNDGEPYSDAQYARVAAIVAHYCRQGLSLDDVVSHAEIAPGRRTDPFGWEWDRFRAMVQEQLRHADAEGRHSIVYDRRSRERLAADLAAAHRSAELPSVAVTPSRPAVPNDTRQRPPAPAAAKDRVAVLATPKHVLRSRTLWLNGLTALAAGAAILAELFKLADGFGLVISEDVTKWVLLGLGLVNMVLRVRTTQPLVCGSGDDCSCEHTAVAPPVLAAEQGQRRVAAG